MTLAEEAQRYLAVVEVFRAEGREPHWLPETWAERVRLSSSSPSPRRKHPERRKRCPS